jgi:hypothetical protein
MDVIVKTPGAAARPSASKLARHNSGRADLLWWTRHLWRGSSLPLGCAAVVMDVIVKTQGAAARPSASKLARHNGGRSDLLWLTRTCGEGACSRSAAQQS